eukprot:gene1500-1892_t
MSVPFEQALESLRTMFTDFDGEVIETVLRQNKGHMEKTIDMLLEMNGQQPINGTNTDSDFNIAQTHQDEILARMLQNQLYTDQMRHDQQLQQQLHQQQLQQQRNAHQQQNQHQRQQYRDDDDDTDTDDSSSEQHHHNHSDPENTEYTSPLSLLEEDLNLKEIKEKISQFGEVAKTKFRELSDMFLKKEETKYEAVNTKAEDEDDEGEEEVVVYDRNHGVGGSTMKKRGNIDLVPSSNKFEIYKPSNQTCKDLKCDSSKEVCSTIPPSSKDRCITNPCCNLIPKCRSVPNLPSYPPTSPAVSPSSTPVTPTPTPSQPITPTPTPTPSQSTTPTPTPTPPKPATPAPVLSKKPIVLPFSNEQLLNMFPGNTNLIVKEKKNEDFTPYKYVPPIPNIPGPVISTLPPRPLIPDDPFNSYYGSSDSAGHPNWYERAAHVLINSARIDPITFRKRYFGLNETNNPGFMKTTPMEPLYWNQDLMRISMALSDYQINNNCLVCGPTLASRITDIIPQCHLDNIAKDTSEISLIGNVNPLQAVLYWLCEGPTSQCIPDNSSTIHRNAILDHTKHSMGMGVVLDKTKGKSFWNLDTFGNVCTKEIDSPIRSGSHIINANGYVEYLADFYLKFANPNLTIIPNIIINGVNNQMKLLMGTEQRGVYCYIPNSPSYSSDYYYFEFKDSSGGIFRYPASGYLHTCFQIGETSWSTNIPIFKPKTVDPHSYLWD